jgi:hypothetical protein
MPFFVIGEDNATTWNDDPEGAERFETRKQAEKRAVEMAEYEPGKIFLVCEAVAQVSAEVKSPKINDL